MEIWILLSFAGLIAGFLAGLLGIGGGFVMVPVLMLVLPSVGIAEHSLAHFAIGTSLLCITVTALFSTRAHHQKKAVDWSLFGLISPGLVVGALAGAFIASILTGRFLIIVFVTGATLTAIYLLSGYQPRPKEKMIAWHFTTYGLFSGVISALIGIGGGSLIVPFLVYKGKKVAQAIGTAAACGFPIAVSGAVGYAWIGSNIVETTSVTNIATTQVNYATGYLYWPAFICLVVFSSIAAPLGAKLAHYLPEKRLRHIFAVFLFFTSAQIIYSHWFK